MSNAVSALGLTITQTDAAQGIRNSVLARVAKKLTASARNKKLEKVRNNLSVISNSSSFGIYPPCPIMSLRAGGACKDYAGTMLMPTDSSVA